MGRGRCALSGYGNHSDFLQFPRMTLDELIAQAAQLREEFGGDTPVITLNASGYSSVLLTDSIGFGDAQGAPVPIVLIVPGEQHQ